MIRFFGSRSDLVVIATCAVCALLLVAPVRSQSPNPTPAIDPVELSILLPAYANPHTEEGTVMWKTLAQLSRQRPAGLKIEIIFNPASGPGKSCDRNYLRADGSGPLADVQDLRVYGYVTTGYAQRRAADVKREIDQYATGFYAGLVSGIFFDETSSDLNTAEYYRDLSEYAHAAIKSRTGQPTMTISNPGIGEVQLPVDPERLKAYATAMDRMVVFENAANLYHAAEPAFAEAFLPPHRLAHIVHTQAKWDPSLVDAMRRRGAFHIFMTDATMPNPYHRLPSYFEQLCAWVADFNQSQ